MQTYKQNVPKKNFEENSFSDDEPEDTETTKMKSGFEGGHGHSHKKQEPEAIVEDDDEPDKWLRINLNLEE